jgi:hypothetical protein
MDYELDIKDKKPVQFEMLDDGDYFIREGLLYRKSDDISGNAYSVTTTRLWNFGGSVEVTKVEQTNTVYFK